jgi:hypothetical protein
MRAVIGSYGTCESARNIDRVFRGFPRCDCPEHGHLVFAHGNVPPCTCTSATGAGVDPNCPYITTDQQRIRVGTGAYDKQYAYPVDAATEAVLDAHPNPFPISELPVDFDALVE